MSTISLSNIPELTRATGVPRLAAIEHPFGQTMGQPGQSDHQREVLLAALEALAQLEAPGCVANLPYEWRGSERQARAQPAVPPPIATHLKWHPWLLPRLFARDLPRES